MNMDLCRSSVLTAEKRRLESLEKAAARQRRRAGENGCPTPSSPTRMLQEDQGSALQTEFWRRMKSALLDIPIDELVQCGAAASTKRMASCQRHDFRNLAYASLPELEAEVEDLSPESFLESESRLLSFNGDQSNLQGPHRSSNNWDARVALSSTSMDPYSHNQLHVLQRAAAKSSYGQCIGNAEIEKTNFGLQPTSQKVGRRIAASPTLILDAPNFVDNFYLNLISWSDHNILAVALGQCVYLWEAASGHVEHLVKLEGISEHVTSLSWVSIPGYTKYIAIGASSGAIQLWDTQALKKITTLNVHCKRVSSLSCSPQWLSSGGRDSLILQHDIRSYNHVVSTYKGHTKEVCGLKWNDDGTTLASGGNENYLCIWDAAISGRNPTSANSRRRDIGADMSPRFLRKNHKAAVKALAWCPFRRDLLASGGGTVDRSIKFWNISSGKMLKSVDTGSQVCSLLWSKHQKELVSAHGFNKNELILWKYPTMTKIQEFRGHTSRVLHMEQSPDGDCVVSLAADETLRFWDMFGAPPRRRQSKGFNLGDFSAGLATIR